MLALTRWIDEEVWIDVPPCEDARRIVVKVIRVDGGKVRLGFDADPSVIIDRSEVGAAKQREAIRGK